jgi:hypothetical protein
MTRPRLALAVLLVAAAPGIADAQDSKAKAEPKKAAETDRLEGMITKVEPLGEKDSERFRLTINTGAVWRDYARNVFARDDAKGKAEGKVDQGAEEESVAEGQPETESSDVHVEVNLKTPIQLRYRTLEDERSLGAASADGAAELTEDQVEKAGADDVPDGKQGEKLQPHFLREGQYVVIKAKGADDDPKVEWVIRMEPVRESKGKH